MRFRLLALDLDGTLFNRESVISPANIAAVDRARDAGLRVVVCTGRGLLECVGGLEAINQREPVVVAGGAIIADPLTRTTLHRFNIHQSLVHNAVEIILASKHAALVLKDPLQAGFDYLVVNPEGCPIDPVSQWWFSKMNVEVRYTQSLADDPCPLATVRVGACGRGHILDGAKGKLIAALGDRAVIHNFPAVISPEHAKAVGTGESLNILEIFDRDATKWSAISYLACEWAIEPSQVVAIGDEINDVSMIEGAGLGIAMGNAIPAVKAAAKRVTLSNAESGVAYAIDRVLAGEW
ncbi:MAG: HAD hydrolase family protein [Phycisphaeraceae bacterium]|nr:HAD hydrolase family protein [Phycisphaeraceae bacterium]